MAAGGYACEAGNCVDGGEIMPCGTGTACLYDCIAGSMYTESGCIGMYAGG
jgi:hypothetical protein